MKWIKYSSSLYGNGLGQNIFRVNLWSEDEDPKGNYWAVVKRDGSIARGPHDICRFSSLHKAKLFLYRNDKEPT